MYVLLHDTRALNIATFFSLRFCENKSWPSAYATLSAHGETEAIIQLRERICEIWGRSPVWVKADSQNMPMAENWVDIWESIATIYLNILFGHLTQGARDTPVRPKGFFFSSKSSVHVWAAGASAIDVFTLSEAGIYICQGKRFVGCFFLRRREAGPQGAAVDLLNLLRKSLYMLVLEGMNFLGLIFKEELTGLLFRAAN